MSAHIVRRLGAVLLASALAAGLTGAASAVPAQAEEPAGALELVLDSSGSMAGRDPSGLTKIDAAKRALTGVVDALPAEATVGLRVYGARYKDKARGCRDTELVVPLGPLDRAAAKAAIGRFKPGGYTPIAYSLQQAAKDLPTSGQRTIVLVSDGEETCDADPCAVARSLARQGIGLHVDAVGFGVSAAARRQLTCIAQTTGGRYYDAPDADALKNQLGRLAVRAFRPYVPTGTPVQGTLSANGAPVIRPGQYVDSIKGSEPKYYALDLAAGVTPYVAATVVHPTPIRAGKIQTDRIGVALSTAGGEECGEHSAIHQPNPGIDNPTIPIPPQTGYATPGPVGAFTEEFDGDAACGQPGRYYVSITRTSNNEDDRGELPMEIVLVAEPPVKDASGLPPATEASYPGEALDPRPAATGTVVAGGGSFGDAATVDSGPTYVDSIRTGEVLYYRVKLDWGQRLSYTVNLDPVPGAQVSRPIGVATTTTVSNPVRIDLDFPYRPGPPAPFSLVNYFPTPDRHSTLFAATVPVNFRNRETDDDKLYPASLAGYYYVRVRMTHDRALVGVQVPMRLTFLVSGTPTGQPDYQDVPNAADPGSVTNPKSTGPGADRAAGQEPDTGPVSLRTVAFAGVGGLALMGAVVLALLPWIVRRYRRPTR